jgi:spore coat protein SA
VNLLRILIVAPEQIPVPPLIGGSVEICIHAIATRLAKEHKVTIISRQHPKYPRTSYVDGVTIYRVPTGSQQTYISNVIKKVKNKQFDIIQVDNRPRYAARIKNAFPKTPVTLFLHSLTFVSRPMISRSEAAESMRKPDLILVNSSSLLRAVKRNFPSVSKKLTKVFLGTDLSRFCPPTSSQRRSIRRKYRLNGKFVVLFVGRLIPRKGIPLLIKAIRLLRQKDVPNSHLAIAGGTMRKGYKQELIALAKANHVPVTFVGYIPHRQLHRTYWLGDCFVCPSQKHEAFGLVNVEAMASGLPVVVSNIGGISEIVQHKSNGLVVDRYQSPSHFANQLKKLALNREFASQLGAAAREHVLSQFTWDATVKNLSSIYENQLEK